MYSVADNLLNRLGSPIQKSSGQSLFANSLKLFAGYHVFHRLLLPRHPPYALIHLTMQPVLCVDTCLLYTSDAADDLLCVDLGGRRIIKKKKKKEIVNNEKELKNILK
eukprot:TRINITY_DN43_c0_g1_i11.p2 TRINITY_DN43_c0_g1~~TRINITY_DN43_c0_g1_i11.p2  ORF type:complete len:108 (-),score=15.52 TRINITY_DN43_c0_g1_i11:79-402(-)